MRLEQQARCTAKGRLDGPGTDARVWSLPRQTTAPARRAMMSREGAAANGERAAAPSPLLMALRSSHSSNVPAVPRVVLHCTTDSAEPPTPWRRHERCAAMNDVQPMFMVLFAALRSTAPAHARTHAMAMLPALRRRHQRAHHWAMHIHSRHPARLRAVGTPTRLGSLLRMRSRQHGLPVSR
jgi:hypothetical protein